MQYAVTLSESGNDLIYGPFKSQEEACEWAKQRQGDPRVEELIPPVVKKFVVFLSKSVASEITVEELTHTLDKDSVELLLKCVTVEMEVSVLAGSESLAEKLAIQSAESVDNEQLSLNEQRDFLEKDWSVQLIDENARPR